MCGCERIFILMISVTIVRADIVHVLLMDRWREAGSEN